LTGKLLGLYNFYRISWKVKFAGIRTLRREEKRCSYAYVKANGGGRGVKEANWQFGGVDQRLSYATERYLITP
jgi:hypothetical protein